jgi:hypothetical protein
MPSLPLTGLLSARWSRALVGSVAGATVSGFAGDENSSLLGRVAAGALVGAVLGEPSPSIAKMFQKKAAGFTKMGWARSSTRFLGAGGGAVVGGVVGTFTGYPIVGAAIGAGAGLGLKGADSLLHAYKSSGPIGRLGMVAAGTTVAAGAALALNPGEGPGMTAMASRDDTGMPEYQMDTGARRRLDTINAQGDIVLGLNNRRHG